MVKDEEIMINFQRQAEVGTSDRESECFLVFFTSKFKLNFMLVSIQIASKLSVHHVRFVSP